MRPTHAPGSDATLDLASSAAARDTFVGTLALPDHHSVITGTGNAALAYGVALGNSTWRFGSVAFILGLVVAAGSQAIALRRFRARNGASVRGVHGFTGPPATRPVIVVFLLALFACIIGATWLMVADHPALSALVALAALPVTAVADRWWMARYRLER